MDRFVARLLFRKGFLIADERLRGFQKCLQALGKGNSSVLLGIGPAYSASTHHYTDRGTSKYCYYEGESLENLKSAMKFRTIARLFCKFQH